MRLDSRRARRTHRTQKRNAAQTLFVLHLVHALGTAAFLRVSGGFHESFLPLHPSLVCDGFVVKIRHDFVKCAEYNFL
jgi:hypothetical protein